MKPKRTYKIEYPKLTLEPNEHRSSWDKLELEFRKDNIIIDASIDCTGNTFVLPIELLKKYLDEFHLGEEYVNHY